MRPEEEGTTEHRHGWSPALLGVEGQIYETEVTGWEENPGGGSTLFVAPEVPRAGA